ncbi:hypothetical protein PSTG_10931 [Puccinia striiformis f. sp. tritici PST-78]|uniref:Uncharacterized protein n=1 Tax=Puccinia striiformis f. sp. tritici PST-78 TaxID=1165861 RepID=A0A0L0V8V6_9BASI|nr:hypothetical protein PSTG_10931 [Puccinia striiformis f. sp. tritici PST-78]
MRVKQFIASELVSMAASRWSYIKVMASSARVDSSAPVPTSLPPSSGRLVGTCAHKFTAKVSMRAHASYWASTTLFHTWAYMTASDLPLWAPVTRCRPVRGQTRVTNIANLRCTQR